MVGQVVAHVVGHQQQAGRPALAHMMGGVAAVGGAGHAAVLGYGPQPVGHLVVGEVGRHPEHDVEPRAPDSPEEPEHQRLTGEEPQAQSQEPGSHQAGEAGLDDPVGRDAQQVAQQLAAHRRPLHGVEGVQQEVGLLGTELVAVVVGVAPPVVVGAGAERQPAEDAHADDVVDEAVGEQQPVGRLVVQDEHPQQDHAHHRHRGQRRQPVIDGCDGPDHGHRRGQRRQHGRRVGCVGDAAQLGPELRAGPAVGPETLRAGECGQVGAGHPPGHGRHQIVVGRKTPGRAVRLFHRLQHYGKLRPPRSENGTHGP